MTVPIPAGCPRKSRLRQWEFWPAWIFYLPVALHYARLAIRYGSATVPTCANPGFFTGGLIGESKFSILDALQRTSPEFTAASHLVVPGGDRLRQIDRLLDSGALVFPFVLKPDIGQRGSGFKVIRDRSAAEAYLAAMPSAIVAQTFIEGPLEAGLFYYRMPNTDRGRLLAITDKVFPALVGDGVHTLRELIAADPRASLIAETYLRRFAGRSGLVPASGETIRLVEAGNHAQGCLFQDGMHLWSEALEERVDRISRQVPGFFIGRYDVRYSCPEKLRRGEGFYILELNGASSEATSAYDASKPLRSAYALLFKQWNLVFEIGAANRRAGHKPSPARLILQELRRYRRLSESHPSAD